MAPELYYGLGETDLSSDPEIKTDTETGNPGRHCLPSLLDDGDFLKAKTLFWMF